MVGVDGAAVVAPGPPQFSLHTLGWRAFQDLCAAVLRQVWGQSVQAFADSNDAGRDGAFYGTWCPDSGVDQGDVPEGPFVLQCKHTKSADSTLSISMLGEEFAKVGNLVERGLCGTYVLLTNARVTGASEEAICKRLVRVGVSNPLVLGGQWLCDMIAANRALRMFVPRVYGLGDLSQILDERAYAQASVLMASAMDQISTFVVTNAYRRAAQALQDRGFVLLLGEPAVGKSVIALMLAISAADRWACVTIKARTSDELINRWNPHEKGQLFWIDDAFGTVRHEDHLTHDWARNLPHVMSAVQSGARVVLTSRSYIYRDARPLLKSYAYPLLRESEVTVDVEDISRNQRQQILYNHLVAGDQSAEIRTKMKPHLEVAADAEPFRPEAARRLGLQAFTRNLTVSRQGIVSFIAHSHEFLSDIYNQLDAGPQAALLLVYSAPPSSGLMAIPALGALQRSLIEQVGTTVASTVKALEALTGTFLRQDFQDDGQVYWTFKHPTLREGFAAWLASKPHLLSAFFSGMDDNVLLDQTDCLTSDSRHSVGTSLRLPPQLYKAVAERLRGMFEEWPEGSCWTGSALRYLGSECCDAMLESYLYVDPALPGRLIKFEPFASFVSEPRVLQRLHVAGLLSEVDRQAAVSRMSQLAVYSLDVSWLGDGPWRTLLTEGDRIRLLSDVRGMLVPRLNEAVNEDWTSGVYWRSEDGYVDGGEDPVEYALVSYRQAFEQLNDGDTAQAFMDAIELNSRLRGTVGSGVHDGNRLESPDIAFSSDADENSRSVFADVDEEE